MRLGAAFWDLDNQSGRYFALILRFSILTNEFQKRFNLSTQTKKTIFIAKNSGIRDGQLLNDPCVSLFRVIPNNDAFILDLFSD